MEELVIKDDHRFVEKIQCIGLDVPSINSIRVCKSKTGIVFEQEHAVIQVDVADLRIHRNLFRLQKWLISNNGQGLDTIHICCRYENHTTFE